SMAEGFCLLPASCRKPDERRRTPAPSANAYAALVPATPTASMARWIPSPPLPPLALVTRFAIAVTHSAARQIVAVPAPLPVHWNPPPPPSKLSCVRQSLRSSSLPPDVEAAERTCTSFHAVTCYHLPSRRSGAHRLVSKRAFPIKLRNCLTLSRV